MSETKNKDMLSEEDLAKRDQLIELFKEKLGNKNGWEIQSHIAEVFMSENRFVALQNVIDEKYNYQIDGFWVLDFSFSADLVYTCLSLIKEAGFDLTEAKISMPKECFPMRIDIGNCQYYFIISPMVPKLEEIEEETE